MTSYLTKKIIDYKCIAILVDGLAKNEFEIPFATVAVIQTMIIQVDP
jgi:hypothetical protein